MSTDKILDSFDNWLSFNGHLAPPGVTDGAIFVHDTLVLAKRIAESLELDSEMAIFEIYDRLIQRINLKNSSD
jgi:hypothetical protein